MDYSKRLQKVRSMLNGKCDALIIEDPIHLLYLTGLELSAGKIYISSHATTPLSICVLHGDGLKLAQ